MRFGYGQQRRHLVGFPLTRFLLVVAGRVNGRRLAQKGFICLYFCGIFGTLVPPQATPGLVPTPSRL